MLSKGIRALLPKAEREGEYEQPEAESAKKICKKIHQPPHPCRTTSTLFEEKIFACTLERCQPMLHKNSMKTMNDARVRDCYGIIGFGEHTLW
jgi:hypothetical protein